MFLNESCHMTINQSGLIVEWDHMTALLLLCTDEEGVSVVLFEHSADPRGMLNGKLEHH